MSVLPPPPPPPAARSTGVSPDDTNESPPPPPPPLPSHPVPCPPSPPSSRPWPPDAKSQLPVSDANPSWPPLPAETPSTCPGVTGRVPMICEPEPPIPPISLSLLRPPDPPLPPRAMICRLVTPAGTVKLLKSVVKVSVTGAAACAGELTTKDTPTLSATTGTNTLSTRPALPQGLETIHSKTNATGQTRRTRTPNARTKDAECPSDRDDASRASAKSSGVILPQTCSGGSSCYCWSDERRMVRVGGRLEGRTSTP